MVSKCLNSCCSVSFRYLGTGRLYCVDFADVGRRNEWAGKKTVTSIRSKACPVEYFWLCERCAATMTIELSESGELQLVPLEVSARRTSEVAGQRKYPAQSVGTSTTIHGEKGDEAGYGTGCDSPSKAAG